MNQFEDRLRSAHSHLGEAAVILDEVERAVAVAHTAEVKAERQGAFIVRAGVVIVCATVGIGAGILLLRWFFDEPQAEPDGLAEPDGTTVQARDMA